VKDTNSLLLLLLLLFINMKKKKRMDNYIYFFFFFFFKIHYIFLYELIHIIYYTSQQFLTNSLGISFKIYNT